MHAHVKEPNIRMNLKIAEPKIRIYTYIQTYKSPHTHEYTRVHKHKTLTKWCSSHVLITYIDIYMCTYIYIDIFTYK